MSAGFRIGRKHAQHVYPTRPSFGVPPALLQVGSDQLTTSDQSFTGAAPAVKVEKTAAGALLQVPLNGFRRVNGLWIQVTGVVNREDTGAAVAINFFPWIKFSTLAQYFAPPTGTPVTAQVEFDTVTVSEVDVQPFVAISLTLTALILLPAASSDVVPIALPAVDDILVGIAAQGTPDFSFSAMTSVIAGEMNSQIITQIPAVELATLP
jgi:hypothetical protein